MNFIFVLNVKRLLTINLMPKIIMIIIQNIFLIIKLIIIIVYSILKNILNIAKIVKHLYLNYAKKIPVISIII